MQKNSRFLKRHAGSAVTNQIEVNYGGLLKVLIPEGVVSARSVQGSASQELVSR